MVLRAMLMPMLTASLLSSETLAVTAAAPSNDMMLALSLAATVSPLLAPEPVVIEVVCETLAVTTVAILFSV